MIERGSRRGFQRGFTLIELILVIVMLGVLAVFAAPRMLSTGDFYARGFHDETLGLMRYAQKTAIAQRRIVCVAVTTSADSPPNASANLSLAAVAGSALCDTPLSGPTGGAAVITARSGVDYSASTSFNFNGLGQPSAAQSIQVTNASVAMGNPIIVEADTGYVHD
jgi:MSHA pilin protein MshC